MQTRRALAEQEFQAFLVRADKVAETTQGTPLFAGGIGLDSLETAELSVLLEDALGADPFSEGLLPQTVGELLDFYDEASAAVSS